MLEEIPGIGKKRAAALVAAFGSPRHVASATPEAIADSVPGIGPELAGKIKRHLEGETE